jgi:hypothetical protein
MFARIVPIDVEDLCMDRLSFYIICTFFIFNSEKFRLTHQFKGIRNIENIQMVSNLTTGRKKVRKEYLYLRVQTVILFDMLDIIKTTVNSILSELVSYKDLFFYFIAVSLGFNVMHI